MISPNPFVIIGYESDLAGDVYPMYNSVTRKVISSRDITWSDWRRKDTRSEPEPYSKDKAPGMEEISSSSDEEDAMPALDSHIIRNDDKCQKPLTKRGGCKAHRQLNSLKGGKSLSE
jgi:hypothetical protein